jgi:MerR family transcriptional regulator, light-induced transcriptional regulator
MPEAHHPIQLVARLTGLSPYVIRIWEQRYRAVEPSRTATNRRLYSPSEIDRLRLLAELTRAGHNIGQIARLSDQKLRQLASGSAAGNVQKPAPMETPGTSLEALLAECVRAVEAMDARALEDGLRRAGVALGAHGMLQRVLAPLSQQLGEHWRRGRITAAHEHFATAIIRGYLTNLANAFGSGAGAPVLVVTTPAGQLHELGALLAGATAANLGWQVTQLGASLPATEIAGAAERKAAQAVALSLVYPEDDPRLATELTSLRELLPRETSLIVGGRAAPSYRSILSRVKAIVVADLEQFGTALDRLRRPAKQRSFRTAPGA